MYDKKEIIKQPNKYTFLRELQKRLNFKARPRKQITITPFSEIIKGKLHQCFLFHFKDVHIASYYDTEGVIFPEAIKKVAYK